MHIWVPPLRTWVPVLVDVGCAVHGVAKAGQHAAGGPLSHEYLGGAGLGSLSTTIVDVHQALMLRPTIGGGNGYVCRGVAG